MTTVDPSLSNRDLRPTTPAQRTWVTYSYIALWFSMSMEITTYQLASSLIAKGMDWKQAVGTVLFGNLIVLIPMLLNAHAGTKFGIPFPVFIRASFGIRGANLPAILRAVVACGWFGIQSWIGGTAIHSMLGVIWPAAASAPGVALGVLSRILAVEHGGCLARGRVDPSSAGFRRTLHVHHGGGPADLGAHEGGQFRHHAFDAQPVPHHAGIPCRLLSIAHGNGRLLGHAGAQHSRLHPLLEIADVAGLGPGVRAARRHDALHLRRHLGHLGLGRALRPPHLEPHPAHRRIPSACRRVHRADRHSHRHAQREHRRQCRLAVERFLQPLSAPHQLPYRRV